MKLHVDHDADALHLRLDESKIVESEEVSPNVVLDFDAAGIVVGVEILNLSTRTSPLNLRDFQYQTAGCNHAPTRQKICRSEMGSCPQNSDISPISLRQQQ